VKGLERASHQPQPPFLNPGETAPRRLQYDMSPRNRWAPRDIFCCHTCATRPTEESLSVDCESRFRRATRMTWPTLPKQRAPDEQRRVVTTSVGEGLLPRRSIAAEPAVSLVIHHPRRGRGRCTGARLNQRLPRYLDPRRRMQAKTRLDAVDRQLPAIATQAGRREAVPEKRRRPARPRREALVADLGLEGRGRETHPQPVVATPEGIVRLGRTALTATRPAPGQVRLTFSDSSRRQKSFAAKRLVM